MESIYFPDQIIASKYKLVENIGIGGMGEVWLAEHLFLPKQVAIKFLLSSLQNKKIDLELASQRFKFEAQISAKLGAQTSNVVRVYDAGIFNSAPYMVMEYVPGETLGDLLFQRKTLSPEEFYEILVQIGNGLAAAHKLGIVHRDLKPSNIMLDGFCAKLTDFGVAKALARDSNFDYPKKTRIDQLMGSPIYMAPEQLGGQQIDTRADLWALGIVAYETLTGKDPFYEANSVPDIMVLILTKEIESVSNVKPELARFDAWFKKALTRDKNKRFQTIKEMIDDFKLILDNKTESKPKSLPKFPYVKLGFLTISLSLAACWAVTLPDYAVAQKYNFKIPNIDIPIKQEKIIKKRLIIEESTQLISPKNPKVKSVIQSTNRSDIL